MAHYDLRCAKSSGLTKGFSARAQKYFVNESKRFHVTGSRGHIQEATGALPAIYSNIIVYTRVNVHLGEKRQRKAASEIAHYTLHTMDVYCSVRKL